MGVEQALGRGPALRQGEREAVAPIQPQGLQEGEVIIAFEVDTVDVAAAQLAGRQVSVVAVHDGVIRPADDDRRPVPGRGRYGIEVDPVRSPLPQPVPGSQGIQF
jgi:hypothetical protein